MEWKKKTLFITSPFILGLSTAMIAMIIRTTMIASRSTAAADPTPMPITAKMDSNMGIYANLHIG